MTVRDGSFISNKEKMFQGKKIASPILAAFLLLGLLWKVDLALMCRSFANLRIEHVTLLILISLAFLCISCLKWQLFLQIFGEHVPIVRLMRMYLIGHYVNLFIPSSLGGDAVRTWILGQHAGHHSAFTATLLERYTGIIALLGLACCFTWFSEDLPWQIHTSVFAIALGTMAVTAFVLSALPSRILQAANMFRSAVAHLLQLHQSLLAARERQDILLKTIALSIVFHGFSVLNVATAAYAIGWNSFLLQDLIVVLPLILIIGALPITPAGLGVQEGAFVFFLLNLGATPEQGLGIALILRAKACMMAFAGLLCSLTFDPKEALKVT